MDSQTAVAVQSLLESQTLPEPIQTTGMLLVPFTCTTCPFICLYTTGFIPVYTHYVVLTIQDLKKGGHNGQKK